MCFKLQRWELGRGLGLHISCHITFIKENKGNVKTKGIQSDTMLSMLMTAH